jgi:EAL domain-containing protein (putative c-di-GMP-specific phosphodiesterase class I)
MTNSRLARELAAALDNGEVILLYQPQIDLATGRTVAVEALCRWLHPELGLLLPYAFIPVAEESRLIGRIGEFVIVESLAAAASWRDAGLDVGIAINVSPSQLTSSSFGPRLADAVHESRLDPTTVTLEITETVAIENLFGATSNLDPLRAAGMVVAIDDYGAGYSSLSRLDDLGAGELKIDRTLLQSESPTNATHLTDVVAYAHERSIRVVAEGVERPEHLDRARQLGCDRAQGFLLGRPASQREISKSLLAERV